MRREILFMFVAMSLIPLGDTAGKLLNNNHDVAAIFVSWSRFAIGALCLLPFIYKDKAILRLLRDKRILARGLVLVCTISSILQAFTTVPITTGFSILFIAPLISYLLSVVFLKEVITIRRTALVIGGFMGVLLVAQPSPSMDPNLFFAFLAGSLYGTYLTMSRAFAHLGTPVQMTSTQLILGAVVLSPFALMAFPPLNPSVMILAGVSSLSSLGGNLLLILAYGLAPATRLAPFVYFQIIAATTLGALVFGHWPNTMAWCGMLIIIICGVLSASPWASSQQKAA